MAVNVLMSYALHPTTDLGQLRAEMGGCGRLLVDSGAFTAHTTGQAITLDAYAAYLERWRGAWDHAVTLDVIGDPHATAANTRKLHERGLPVMPVFTRGGTLADFDAMVREHRYVCVGGLVGLPNAAQVARAGVLQRRAATAGGGIHALGMGSLLDLRKVRPYSADSATVGKSFVIGAMAFFDGRRMRQVHVAERATIRRWLPQIRAHGIDAAALLASGRIPTGDAYDELIAAMSVGYAVADEKLKREQPTLPPDGLTDPGPHLYVAMRAVKPALAVAAMSRRLHTADAPPLWSTWNRHHQCTTRERTTTP